jgi:hypothetical protein
MSVAGEMRDLELESEEGGEEEGFWLCRSSDPRRLAMPLASPGTSYHPSEV